MVKRGELYIVTKTLRFYDFKIPKGTILRTPKVIPRWAQTLLIGCIPIVWERSVRIVGHDNLKLYTGKKCPQ